MLKSLKVGYTAAASCGNTLTTTYLSINAATRHNDYNRVRNKGMGHASIRGRTHYSLIEWSSLRFSFVGELCVSRNQS